MSIIAWIVLGLIAGFIASKIVNKTGEGIILDIVLGVVGAVVGGWLFSVFGMSGVSGLNIFSFFVAGDWRCLGPVRLPRNHGKKAEPLIYNRCWGDASWCRRLVLGGD